MVFNSYAFLIFFGSVLVLYRLIPSWRGQKTLLLVASYVFYAAWNPPFVVLVWISTVVDWYAAGAMARTSVPRRRRAWLLLSLATNLGLLGFFKYGEFLLVNFQAVAALVGVTYQPPPLDIVLPVGISFYTFQTLSYTIDVYRRDARPWHSFLDFALYVTFFPQLVAGPIVRATQFLPQLVWPVRASRDQIGWGLTLLTVGLFEKVVLADAILAPRVDAVYGATAEAGFSGAWIGTLAFSGQIFCDFAGYSTCAIGAALCLGFALPDNFRNPYAAIGFSDFWRRWHISLSRWLRDYLYIPLGGNRRGPGRAYVNVMITMLLGGLWHGASWRFVAWGGLHGLYLMMERLMREAWGSARWVETTAARVGLALGTYALVCVTWVFFRARSFGDALALVGVMFDPTAAGLVVGPHGALLVLGVTAFLLAGQWLLRETSFEDAARRVPWWARVALLSGLLLSIALAPGEDRAFIYFQF